MKLYLDNSPTNVLKDVVVHNKIEYTDNPSNSGFGAAHNLAFELVKSQRLVVASKIPAFLEFKSKNIIHFDQNSEDDLSAAISRANRLHLQMIPIFSLVIIMIKYLK